MKTLTNEIFDIFVSYRFKDGELISRKVADALKDMGYSVYHNSDRNHRGKFPDRLRSVIDNSRDFLLIVTENCLERLIADKDSDSPDWVKEELLEAIAQRKNIIPVMIESIEWPHLSSLPDEAASLIRDLSVRENIQLPVNFEQESPLILLCGKLASKRNAGGRFRNQNNDLKYADMKKLLENLTSEANEGNPAAMYQLVIFYRSGLGNEPGDNVKEYFWLQKLSELECDSDEAKKYKSHELWHIGAMYQKGEVPGERQSYAKSYSYKEMAGKLYPDIPLSNIMMKSRGSGTVYDYEDIISTFKNTNIESMATAIFDQANFFYKYGDFARAIDLFSLIYHIHNEASYKLGKMYMLGVDSTPPEPNGIAATFYFTQAAERGHAEAAYFLGKLYFDPPISKTKTKNIHQDIELAVKYFTIAANNNHTDALYYLEWIYSYNLGADSGIQRDFTKAIEYGEKAAKNGSINAMVELIRLYQYEECRNYERAYYYAVKAAKGHRRAALCAGYFLLFGRGCEPDLNEAKKYFQIAFDNGLFEAQYMLDLIKEIEEQGNALN